MIKWSFKELAEVDSTQDALRKLGTAGAEEGTVVVAGRQTAGRGRQGRNWVSPEGGLYMSLLLRPPTSGRIETLTIAASLAVTGGITNATGLKVRIRWPNDVMVDDKKLAGVIAESSYVGEKLLFTAVGIGVNCNAAVPMPESERPTTSLAEELGKKIDITRIRGSILEAFSAVYEKWLDGADIAEAARSTTGTIGRRITVVTKSGEALEGVARNLDSNGGLILEKSGGTVVLRAEDVEFLKEV